MILSLFLGHTTTSSEQPILKNLERGTEIFLPEAGPKGATLQVANIDRYSKALAVGFQLGFFASSDYISTHTRFGGVSSEQFIHEEIKAGFKTRHTDAADWNDPSPTSHPAPDPTQASLQLLRVI